MDYKAFAVPILPGRTAAARAFLQELDGPRSHDYAIRQRAIGVTKELWFLQETLNGDLLVIYLESTDFARGFNQFAESREPFDVWFKERFAAVTGVDRNTTPQGPLSELVAHYAV